MRELAEAGVTDSFSRFPSLESVRSALDAAQTAGVKPLVVLPELRRDPQTPVRQPQNHPALGGCWLSDEPNDLLDVSIVLDPAVNVSAVAKQGQIERLPSDRFAAAIPPGDVAILTWLPAAEPAK